MRSTVRSSFANGTALSLAVFSLAVLCGCDGRVSTTPPIDVPVLGPWETALSADGTYSVAWRVVGGAIPKADPFDVEVRILDAGGNPADVSCMMDAEMPEHGHGMNVVPVMEPRGRGEFLAKGLLLHMPGRWSIMVDVKNGAITERAQFLYLMP